MSEIRGWKHGPLSQVIASLDTGVSVNAEDRPHGAGEIGILKTSALTGGVFRPEQNKAVLVAERALVTEPVAADSVLVSRMNTPALVGESCYVTEEWPTLFVPDRIWQLKQRDEQAVSMRWLSYVLRSAKARAHIETHATGTSGSMKNLAKGRFLDLTVDYPPVVEQRSIAQVLDTLDTTIRQTQALIAKLKLVKQGLLHDLLTRGIAANGELRPPHSEAPHLYKASPLGLIPKEWTINSLDSVAEVLDPNPSHRNPIYIEQGFPFISTVEFLDTDEVETDTPRRVAESTVIDQERICAFGAWSIGFSRKGTIGETRFLPTGIRFALLDSLCVINAKSQVIPSFLMHSLRGRSIQHQIKLATMGVALPQLSIGRVRELLVLTPSIDEQQRVAQPIDEVVEKIGCEMGLLRKFQRTKSGLMDDLLTGRVRVTPLLAQAQATQP